MTVVKTNLGDQAAARNERVQPTGSITATDVQGALKGLDAALSGKVSQVGDARYPAAAATVAILATDVEVAIDTTAQAVAANLPSAAAWAAANPNGLELTLIDINGHADTHNITPSLNGADTFSYGGVTPVITSKFGLLRLRPAGSPSITGWYVRGLN